MKFVISFAAVLLLAISSQALMIAPFPGLPKLIEEADAIAIIRIEEDISSSVMIDGITTVRCFVYRNLKGNLRSERVTLNLFDTRGSFVSPFATSSTHLVFLSTNQPAGESPFHVLHYEGSILRLSPLGHEAEPDGSNLERKIKILLERSIAYWDREQQREKELLMAVITGMSSPMTRQLEKAGRPTWASTKFDKSIRVLPFLDFDGIAVKAIMRFQPEGNYWTVQLNLISETPEDLNKEKPPTMRVFGPTGVPIKVVGDGGFSEIDGVPFLMYRVEAKGHEEIALVEVEFNGIERQFELRKPEAIAEVNSQYFIHFGLQGNTGPQHILTTGIRIGEPFYASAGDLQKLRGSIEIRDGKLHASELKDSTGSQTGFYTGSLTNETPVFANASGQSGALWFAGSTNADSGPILTQLKESEIESIWNGLWNAAPKPVSEPFGAKERTRLEGVWKCKIGVTPDLITLSIFPDHKIEISGEKDGRPWTKTGKWKIMKGKCVIYLEGKSPNFIIRIKDDFFMFDPWTTNMLSKLLR